MHFNVTTYTGLGASQVAASGKEPTCQCRLDIGDAGSTPELGRSPGGGNGQPAPGFLPGESHGQRSLTGCSHRVAESDTTDACIWGFPDGSVVKICLPMQEMCVWSLDWEESLGKEMATHSCMLAWKISWTEETAGYCPRRHKESDMI